MRTITLIHWWINHYRNITKYPGNYQAYCVINLYWVVG